MTKPLTERQQLARIKKAAEGLEQAAVALERVEDSVTLPFTLTEFRRELMRAAIDLGAEYAVRQRAMEGRDGGQPESK
jgi:hypothetical protein